MREFLQGEYCCDRGEHLDPLDTSRCRLANMVLAMLDADINRPAGGAVSKVIEAFRKKMIAAAAKEILDD